MPGVNVKASTNALTYYLLPSMHVSHVVCRYQLRKALASVSAYRGSTTSGICRRFYDLNIEPTLKNGMTKAFCASREHLHPVRALSGMLWDSDSYQLFTEFELA